MWKKWGKQSTNKEEEVENKRNEGENGVRCRRHLPEASKTWNKSIEPDKEQSGGGHRLRKREQVNTGEDVETILKTGERKRKRNLAPWWRNKQLRDEGVNGGQQIHIWIVITCMCRSRTAERSLHPTERFNPIHFISVYSGNVRVNVHNLLVLVVVLWLESVLSQTSKDRNK